MNSNIHTSPDKEHGAQFFKPSLGRSEQLCASAAEVTGGRENSKLNFFFESNKGTIKKE